MSAMFCSVLFFFVGTGRARLLQARTSNCAKTTTSSIFRNPAHTCLSWFVNVATKMLLREGSDNVPSFKASHGALACTLSLSVLEGKRGYLTCKCAANTVKPTTVCAAHGRVCAGSLVRGYRAFLRRQDQKYARRLTRSKRHTLLKMLLWRFKYFIGCSLLISFSVRSIRFG